MKKNKMVKKRLREKQIKKQQNIKKNNISKRELDINKLLKQMNSLKQVIGSVKDTKDNISNLIESPEEIISTE
jgi:hypothetical protein